MSLRMSTAERSSRSCRLGKGRRRTRVRWAAGFLVAVLAVMVTQGAAQTPGPTNGPTARPTPDPTAEPSRRPTLEPTTAEPTPEPTPGPSSSPTQRPTERPTTRAPSRSPTQAPSMAPTVCTESCPAGKFNINWSADKQASFCREADDQSCVKCPRGFFKTTGSIYTPCVPCGGEGNYCRGGTRYARTSNLCTFQSSVLEYFRTLDVFDGNVREENVGIDTLIPEMMVRDAQAPCGTSTVSSSNLEVQITKPASSIVTVELINSGSLPLEIFDVVLPDWISLFDSRTGTEIADPGGFSLFASASKTRNLRFLVKSAAIPDNKLVKGPTHSTDGIFLATEKIRLKTKQVFVNTHISEFTKHVVDVTVSVLEPSLTILPSENSWSMNIGTVQRQTLVLYNMQVNTINWISEVEFGPSEEDRTDWLSITPERGSLEQGFGCTKRGQVISTGGENTAELAVTIDGSTLKPGKYSAAVHIRHRTKPDLFRVTSAIRLEVLPGSVVARTSTFDFLTPALAPESQRERLLSNADDGVDGNSNLTHMSLRLPNTELEIFPRDSFGILTNQFDATESSTKFNVTWVKLNAAEPGQLQSRTILVQRNPIDNKFVGDLDIRQKGLFRVSVQLGDQHANGSPFLLDAMPRVCHDTPNSEPHPDTGFTCVCSAGFGKLEESQSCDPCPTGQYRGTDMLVSTPYCRACEAGMFQDEVGSTQCKFCPLGHQTNPTQSGCVPCQDNHVVDESSPSRKCVPCGTEHTVVNHACVCRPEFYRVKEDSEECAPCPKGGFCGYGDATTILPRTGYWRTTWDPLHFEPCSDEDACLGVDESNEYLLRLPDIWDSFVRDPFNTTVVSGNEASRLVSVPSAETMNGCAEGLTGPLCKECAKGYYPIGNSFGCSRCDAKARTIGIFFVSVACGILALFYLILRTIRAKGAPRRREVMVLKIVLSHLQIIAMTKKFALQWPPVVSSLFSIFDILSSAGSSALSTHCLFYSGDPDESQGGAEMGYPVPKELFNSSRDADLETGLGENESYRLSSWVFLARSLCYGLAPVFLAMLFVLVWKYFVPLYRDCSQDLLSAREKVIVSNVVMLIVLQPFLTRAGFEFFSCSEAIDGREFLEAQYTVQCWVGVHQQWIVFGALMLTFYAIGIPFSTTAILFCVVRRTVFRAREAVESFVQKRLQKRADGKSDFPRARKTPRSVTTSPSLSESSACDTQGLDDDNDNDDDNHRGGDKDRAHVTLDIANLPMRMQSQRNHDENSATEIDSLDRWRPVYGFIYSGYRKECFYWEIVIMLRKFAFATVSVILRPVGVDIQTYSGLLVLVLSIVLHVQFRPYSQVSRLHFIEICSLSICFLTLMCGLLIFSPNTDAAFKQVCTMLIVLSNLLFFLYVFYSIRETLKESAVKLFDASKSVVLWRSSYGKEYPGAPQRRFASDSDYDADSDEDAAELAKTPFASPKTSVGIESASPDSRIRPRPKSLGSSLRSLGDSVRSLTRSSSMRSVEAANQHEYEQLQSPNPDEENISIANPGIPGAQHMDENDVSQHVRLQ